jgi:hypothetical protein
MQVCKCELWCAEVRMCRTGSDPRCGSNSKMTGAVNVQISRPAVLGLLIWASPHSQKGPSNWVIPLPHVSCICSFGSVWPNKFLEVHWYWKHFCGLLSEKWGIGKKGSPHTVGKQALPFLLLSSHFSCSMEWVQIWEPFPALRYFDRSNFKFQTGDLGAR